MASATLTVESRLSALEASFRDDHKLLNGNGQKGLHERVTSLEADRSHYDEKFDQVERKQEELDNKLDKIDNKLSSLSTEVKGIQQSVDRIYEKNRWFRDIIRVLGWLLAFGLTVYEAYCKLK